MSNISDDKSLEFWSVDRRFGLRISGKLFKRILSYCEKAISVETGGVLAGYYTDQLDCAIITSISAIPKDSKGGRTWFYRGIAGLQEWLDQLWTRDRHYYLGEWHFHPDNEPVPSGVDINQMKKTAQTIEYHCPEPILLIIGGDLINHSLKDDVRAYVYPKGRSELELTIID